MQTENITDTKTQRCSKKKKYIKTGRMNYWKIDSEIHNKMNNIRSQEERKPKNNLTLGQGHRNIGRHYACNIMVDFVYF